MKNTYKIIIGLLVLLMAVACEQEYEAPNEFSDVAWYTNQQNGIDYKVKVGTHMSFMDLSHNSLSHEWEIENANEFLLPGFSNNDSLVNFIDDSQSSITEDLTVHILFQKSGLNTVHLYNTYSETVTYRGASDFTAVQKGDLWVIDTTFIVDAYGPLLPAYEVYKIIDDTLGNIISEELILTQMESDYPRLKDSASWNTVVLEAGSRIKLLDLTTEDRPNARQWTINNQNPAAIYMDSASTVYFNSLGNIAMMGSLKSQRVQAVGDDTPAESAIKIIPLKVQVIKSTKPFIPVGSFKEVEGKEAISFIVSGEVLSIANAETAFTVHVTNAGTGFAQDIPVTLVQTNTNDASLIELTLSDTIYGNDVVTVAFDNTIGTLTSVDGRALNSFAAEAVEMAMKGENILVDASGTTLRWAGYEEDANTNPKNGFMTADAGTGVWWSNNPAFFKSDDKAFSGSSSLKYDADPSTSSDLWHMKTAESVSFPAGTYLVRQKIFIKEGSDIKVLSTDLGDQAAGWALAMDLSWDLSTIERGKWVEIEETAFLSYALGSSNNGRWGYYVKSALNPGVASIQTFYLDDLEIIPIESRP